MRILYKIQTIIIAIIIISPCCYSQTQENKNYSKFKFYEEKYKVECLNQKITDNFGNGYDSLYGTRNMRTILFGVAYRGGANNFYHKESKRENQNPLPEDGLNNLLNQGFSASVYLYA